jgi:hypothetical protein
MSTAASGKRTGERPSYRAISAGGDSPGAQQQPKGARRRGAPACPEEQTRGKRRDDLVGAERRHAEVSPELGQKLLDDVHAPLGDERLPKHATVITKRLGIARRPEVPQQARRPLAGLRECAGMSLERLSRFVTLTG